MPELLTRVPFGGSGDQGRDDLEAFWDFTAAEWSTAQATAYLRQVHEALELLASQPRIGRRCDEVRPGYRKFLTGAHVIFYMVTAESAIDVVRILHQRMDVTRNL